MPGPTSLNQVGQLLANKKYSMDIGVKTIEWKKGINKQIECLTKFDEQIENINLSIFSAKYHIGNGLSEFNGTIEMAEIRLKDINANIKHSGYLCQLFQCFVRGEVRKLNIIVNLIKANALDLEYYLRECCEKELCSEQHYKNRVEEIMGELKSYEEMTELFVGAIDIQGTDPTYTYSK